MNKHKNDDMPQEDTGLTDDNMMDEEISTDEY